MTTIPERILSAGLSAGRTVYAYDLDRLRARCQRLTALPIPRKRLFFATMANDQPEILACIHSSGLGAFVNSFAHLKLARQAGFQPANIVYAASNMLPEEMEECLAQRVHLVLDSAGQVGTLCGLPGVRGARIGLRVNVGVMTRDRSAVAADPSYRFGVAPEELPLAVATARRAGISIAGAHSYFGTGILEPRVLVSGLKRLAAAAPALPDLEYLDVAGGLGVPDRLDAPEFDLDEYGRQMASALRAIERKLRRELTICVEPGRYVVADCGYYFVTVVDCNLRADRAFVGTTGSVATFPRPLLYPQEAHHPCELLTSGPRPVHPVPIFVCGNSTYSQDFLARGISLPLPRPGETLAFHYAGAYGRSMMSRFLGKEAPAEVVVGAQTPMRLVANT
jgi:diaminopimelate decarboxylase